MRFCGSHERLCEEGLTVCLTPPTVLVGNRTHNQCLRSVMKSSLSHIVILVPLLMNWTCNQCPRNVPRSHIHVAIHVANTQSCYESSNVERIWHIFANFCRCVPLTDVTSRVLSQLNLAPTKEASLGVCEIRPRNQHCLLLLSCSGWRFCSWLCSNISATLCNTRRAQKWTPFTYYRARACAT